MSTSKFVVCHFAVIAAASALLAGCGGGDISSAELAAATVAGATVRTPLVDDEGWPMPPDPEPADIAPSAAADRRATP